MRIFDSQKNRKWVGSGFASKINSLTILKVAKFYQQVELKAGEYSLRIVGKKKVGVGGIDVEFVNNSEVILQKFKVDFNSSTWSEQVFSFKIAVDAGISKMKIMRSSNSVGTIEITRISLDAKLDELQINIPSNGKPISTSSSAILFSPTINSNINIAFIIPYGIYGGAEVYIKNIINNLPNDIVPSIFYLKNNELKNNITNSLCHHYLTENSSDLTSGLVNGKYQYIIYYNRLDVYNLLNSLKSRSIINSNLIEIYHSNFVWPGSLSNLKQRSNLYKLISVSPSLSKDISGISDITEVIPVGIDTEIFSRNNEVSIKKELGLDNKRVIGTVARLSKEKNIDKILDIALKMPDFYFLVVGDGPERSNLEKRIINERIENIRLVGHVSNVYNYYNIFDAFLLTSEIEGTPISIIEAMSSEVIVFTTNVGAISDLVKEGETGFFIKNASDAKNIIEDNIDNKIVVANAKNLIHNNYNIKNNVKRFSDIIYSIKLNFNKILQKNIFYSGEETPTGIKSIHKSLISSFRDHGKVSIIINNYNKGNLLRKSVSSALSQDYKNIEVIVIDDNSNDNILEILNGIKDSRLKIYLNQKNCGAYACRNFAMEIAEGDYITFLDSDDYILKDHIKYLVNGLEKLKLKAINSKYSRIDDRGKVLATSLCEPSILFRKSILNEIGYFHMVRFAADSEFRERLIKFYGRDKVKILNYCSYMALSVPNSLTTTKETRGSSPARMDYVKKFRSNKNLYYHYKSSMDFFNLHDKILTIELNFDNFKKLK